MFFKELFGIQLPEVTDKWAFLRATDAVYTGGGHILGIRLSEKHQLMELVLDEQFKYLEYLYISDHKTLKTLTFKQPMPHLTHIYADNCALTEIIIPAGCNALEQIYLQGNKLGRIKFEGNCKELQLLDLSNNMLTDFNLPTRGFGKLNYLYLHDNLDLDEWKDIISKAATDKNKNVAAPVLRELKRLREDILYDIFEAKMILIGNGEVGKSSIRRSLVAEKSDLTPQPDRTAALDIVPYTLPNVSTDLTGLDNSTDFRLNIWDFGGQGCYREIQQVFCSRKSLYLFVTSNDDAPNNDFYIDFPYWYSMVDAYGNTNDEKSPILYVENEKKDFVIQQDAEDDNHLKRIRARRIDKQRVKHQVKIDCANYETFICERGLITKIKETLKDVGNDIFKTKFTSKWIAAKRHLESYTTSYIETETYVDWCATNQNMDRQEVEDLLDRLDCMGKIIYFRQHEKLKNIIVLDPTWIKEAIVKVIDSDLVQEKGHLTQSRYKYIWDGKDEAAQDIFINFLEAYNLAFEIDRKGTLCVPSALFEKSKPLEDIADLKPITFAFELRYAPFLPAGTVNKLMVRLNKDIYNGLIWRNGCVLHDASGEKNVYAEVEEDWRENKVSIHLRGDESGDFFKKIEKTLEEINQNLKDTKSLARLDFKTYVKRGEIWSPLSVLDNEQINVWKERAIVEKYSKNQGKDSQQIINNFSETKNIVNHMINIGGNVTGNVTGVNHGSIVFNEKIAQNFSKEQFDVVEEHLKALDAAQLDIVQSMVKSEEAQNSPETDEQKENILEKIGGYFNKVQKKMLWNLTSAAAWDLLKAVFGIY